MNLNKEKVKQMFYHIHFGLDKALKNFLFQINCSAAMSSNEKTQGICKVKLEYDKIWLTLTS